MYAETDGAGTVLREYITLGGATIAIIDAGGMSFVHNDHLATPQVMTDGAAAVVWDASYRPFGEATIAGAAANHQRFPGQTADAETGYHDNWYRTYDPSLGRYLQSDPIGIMAGFNTYAYANGNPVMYADPTGQNPAVATTCLGLIAVDGPLPIGDVACAGLATAALVYALYESSCPSFMTDRNSPSSGGGENWRDTGSSPPSGHNNPPPLNPWPIAVLPDWFEDETTWPGWSAKKDQTSWENAANHYWEHYREFPELNSVDDYVKAANEFVANPPSGTLNKTRLNGDRVFYDPATNTFAVANPSGVPRTMFRPNDGILYWWAQ